MPTWDRSRTHSKCIRPTAKPYAARVCGLLGQMGQIKPACNPFPARTHAHARVAVIWKLRPIRPIRPKSDAGPLPLFFGHGSFLEGLLCGAEAPRRSITGCPKNRHFRFPSVNRSTMDNPPFAFTADELAACFSLTPRRIRQFAEDGDLPRLGRGTFDGAWLCYLLMGRRRTENSKVKPTAPVCVAIGWRVGAPGTPEEREAFVGLFERNGLSRDDALLALGAASGVRQ